MIEILHYFMYQVKCTKAVGIMAVQLILRDAGFCIIKSNDGKGPSYVSMSEAIGPDWNPSRMSGLDGARDIAYWIYGLQEVLYRVLTSLLRACVSQPRVVVTSSTQLSVNCTVSLLNTWNYILRTRMHEPADTDKPEAPAT